MKSYLKFLSRHRLFTLINIVGLCLSMAFLLLLGDLIYRQTTVENYQTRADRTFVVGNETFMMSHFRVGQRLKDRFPEVEDWCSVTGYPMTFTIDGQEAETKVLVTGQNFFTFFDYRLLTGDRRKVLSAPNQIVVSKAFAQRYWPGEDPVGKEMVLGDDEMELGDANDGKGHITYTVSGLMDDFDRSIIPDGYECVFNVDNLRHFHYSAWSEDMGNAASCALFLMQREGTDLRSKAAAMRDYLKTFFWLYQIEAVKELTLTPLSSLYYDAKECAIGQEDINHGSREMARLYAIVALLVLVFAIFNYVNLSVSLTTERSKEMATRRLLGSSRWQVFGKLIGESIGFTAVAFVLAYLLALTLQDKAIEMANCRLDLLKDTGVVAVVGFIIAIALTGLMAGFVPASVLSGYQPIDIVRGTFRRRVRQRWSHGLMVLQTVFAIVMLTVTLLLGSGIRERMNRPLGYDVDNILKTYDVGGLNESQRQTFRSKLLALPEVEAVGFGFGTPVEGLENMTVQADDGTVVSQRLLMGDSCFFNILNIHPERTYSDTGWGVNHQLLRQFGKGDDTRKIVTADGKVNFNVRAVYPDMVYQNVMYEEEHPTPFVILNAGEYHDDVETYTSRMFGKPRQALVKYHGERQRVGASAGIKKKVEEAIKQQIKAATGHEAGDVYLLSQSHEEWYKDYKRFLSVLSVFTLVALLIAVLGLMAMNSYFVGQRRREIAIRRVFGAEVSGITLRLLRTIALQSLVAVVIAVPLACWLAPVAGSISGLTIRMQFLPLLLSLVIVLTVNILTAALQSWRAATDNPINSIKTE
ncbi:MAG: FtsX-like permease family protein [Prevotella sp.]|nr:FtsX-like permease family protein [Prevotella sp.]